MVYDARLFQRVEPFQVEEKIAGDGLTPEECNYISLALLLSNTIATLPQDDVENLLEFIREQSNRYFDVGTDEYIKFDMLEHALRSVCFDRNLLSENYPVVGGGDDGA